MVYLIVWMLLPFLGHFFGFVGWLVLSLFLFLLAPRRWWALNSSVAAWWNAKQAAACCGAWWWKQKSVATNSLGWKLFELVSARWLIHHWYKSPQKTISQSREMLLWSIAKATGILGEQEVNCCSKSPQLCSGRSWFWVIFWKLFCIKNSSFCL